MPIEIFWANAEKTIIHAQFGEIWTLEEYHRSIDEMYSLHTSVKHTVHTINDFTHSRSSPARLLSTGQHIESRRATNAGINVIVGVQGFLKVMLQVAQRMYLTDIEIHLANSVEEAHKFIQSHQGKAGLRS